MATPIPVNTARFTLGELVEATGATLHGAGADLAVTGVSTDTRALATGALFVALVGETHDGHRHLETARAQGAAAVLVRRGTACELPRIEVDDTLVALGMIARAHVRRARARRRVPCVAITGSAGKTTTKELCAALARARYGATLATVGNLNNLVGVPMTLLTLGDAHQAMVIECGTSARGEIARLGAVVEPEVAVVLNADAGHTLGLGTVADVAVEKSALWHAATRALVGNADDAVSLERMPAGRARSVTFGEAPGAGVRLVARDAMPDGRARVTLALDRGLLAPGAPAELTFPMRVLGRAAALDAAAAVGAMALLADDGLDARDLAAMAAALESVSAPPGRLDVGPLGEAVLIDDTYNANPRSVRASLAAARELAEGTGGRLLAVLGDMRELGALSRELHAQIGAEAVASGVSVLVCVGDEMAHAAQAAARATVPAGAHAPLVVALRDATDAAGVLRSELRRRDVVLVKGSRGMRMERVVAALRGAGGEAGEPNGRSHGEAAGGDGGGGR